MVIKPNDPLPTENDKVDNFVFSELTLDEDLLVIQDTEDDRVGQPALSEKKQDIIDAFNAKGLTILEEAEETEDDPAYEFARQGSPLFLRLSPNVKILSWEAGAIRPGLSCNATTGALSYITGGFNDIKAAIEELYEGRFSFDGVYVADWSPPDYDCNSSGVPNSPVADDDINFDPEEDGLWTGNIHDYAAIVWWYPTSTEQNHLAEFECQSGEDGPDALFIGADRPFWLDQILEEGYDGKLIIVTSGNSITGEVPRFPHVNEHINSILGELGSSMSIPTEEMSWGDNSIFNPTFRHGQVAEHPLMDNVTYYPHLNSAPIEGGTPLVTPEVGSEDYSSPWCEFSSGDRTVSPYNSVMSYEELTVGGKPLTLIVSGVPIHSPASNPLVTYTYYWLPDQIYAPHQLTYPEKNWIKGVTWKSSEDTWWIKFTPDASFGQIAEDGHNRHILIAEPHLSFPFEDENFFNAYQFILNLFTTKRDKDGNWVNTPVEE